MCKALIALTLIQKVVNFNMDIQIRYIGGNCPVQSEGTIDGAEFYFRARGDSWTLGVGGEPVMEPDWFYEEGYGTGPYDAGGMTVEEAEAFLRRAAQMYHAHSRQASSGKANP